MDLNYVALGAFGVLGTWSVVNIVARMLTDDILQDKSTDELRAIKNYRESSVPKKILYTILPEVYYGIQSAQRRRSKLEKEFAERLAAE